MIRSFLAALAVLSAPVAAQELMTDAERQVFREEVRAYLLDNPEVLMEALAVLEEREAVAQAQADQAMLANAMDRLVNDPYSYVAGNPEGDITIVEFLDYRCGYCKRAHTEVAQLLGSDSNIRLIIKEFPILGEQSVLASQFAVATKLVEGDDAYSAVHDTLMTLRGDVTEAALRRMAEALVLDADAIFARMETEEVKDVLRANRALGAELQINGTPTFVVADEMVRGYVPFDEMVRLVAAARG